MSQVPPTPDPAKRASAPSSPGAATGTAPDEGRHAVKDRRRILVVEDEPDIVRGLTDSLEFEGFEVISAPVGKEGVRLMRERGADCVILDLMLPDINGYQVCEEIRAFNTLVPIIILTARGQESDKIRGLDAGADDYVTKPFSIGELLARIKAIFRRLQKSGGGGGSDEVIRIGSGAIDIKKHLFSPSSGGRGRKATALTFYEVELVKLLFERVEQPVSRDEILDKIWGLEAYPSNRTVDNFIVKLRKKIESDHKAPQHILTVYGFGYKLVP